MNTARIRYEANSSAVVSLITITVDTELDCYDMPKIFLLHIFLHIAKQKNRDNVAVLQ